MNDIVLAGTLDDCVIESLGDGPGIRLVIFTNGCPHRCKGCHNPRTWDINKGTKYPVKEVADYLINKYRAGRYQGITLTGGDPLYQTDALYALLSLVRREIPDIDIWCYTGYKYENVPDKKILSLINVLVDGPFEEDKKFPQKKFRGSYNQRILYLKDGCIVHEE